VKPPALLKLAQGQNLEIDMKNKLWTHTGGMDPEDFAIPVLLIDDNPADCIALTVENGLAVVW
jgi:hypothetical protein